MKDKAFVLIVIFCVWQILHYVDSFLIPSFFQIVEVIPKVLGESKSDILSSVYRVLESFTISIFVAVPTGLVLGRFKRLYSAVSYVLDFFRSTPATALFPLFLIIFGVGDSSKIVSAAFASFLIITFNLAEGIVRIHKHKLLTAKIMGANNIQIIKKIIF
jgi:NitT/TauT family transport system permease protein